MMTEDQGKQLIKEIQDFEKTMQDLVDAVITQYESFMRTEDNVKGLLKSVGEIPITERAKNEHKTDT